MKRTQIIIFLFYYSSFLAIAQNNATVKNMEYYQKKINTYLDKQKSLQAYYLIDKNGIKIYSSFENKSNNKSEFEIDYSQINDFNALLKSSSSSEIFSIYKKGKYTSTEAVQKEKENPKKLAGYKIAIDPGHIANNFNSGFIEKKYLSFVVKKPNSSVDSIKIAEGTLTYATALLLKNKLEMEGAEVFITRKNGTSAFGKSFDLWKAEDAKKSIDSLFKIGEITQQQKDYFSNNNIKDADLFRVIFKNLELAKRAELINNFQPDFTIIIHFNVDETNLNWKKTSDKNFNMAFIGGAFMRNDLSSSEKRFEFLRMIVSNDIEESLQLSGAVVRNFEKTLEVKTAQSNDAKYLSEGCLNTPEKGVYCRNLQLTRYVHGPLVYGETLYQDNKNECQLLNKETDKTKNKRVQQVAEAFYQGIIEYINSK